MRRSTADQRWFIIWSTAYFAFALITVLSLVVGVSSSRVATCACVAVLCWSKLLDPALERGWVFSQTFQLMRVLSVALMWGCAIARSDLMHLWVVGYLVWSLKESS